MCFIDSFVVDKKDFLEAYKISPESGKLFMYDTYFENSNSKGGTVYETELGNKIYYSELQKDSTLNILSRNKMMNEWGKGNMLPGSINESMNAIFNPLFLAADTPFFLSCTTQILLSFFSYIVQISKLPSLDPFSTRINSHFA